MKKLKVGLLKVNSSLVRGLAPTTVLNVKESSSANFHPRGLFSIETYGPIGSEERTSRFSYIKLNTEVIHPVVYHWLVKSKNLYREIITGKSYVLFDENLKDFVRSNEDEGETGFEFFISHIALMDIEDSGSVRREAVISLINKYRDRLTMTHLLVIPAGLRDYTIDESGKPSEDEINDYYRRVIGLSTNITEKESKSVGYNKVRTNLQNSVEDIYDYINSLLRGKHKLINGKFSKRKVFHATGNVLTSVPITFLNANDKRRLGENEFFVGMYQYMKGNMPLFVPFFKESFISKVFPGSFSDMYLCDKKTLAQVPMPLDSKLYDAFMTFDGIDKLVNAFASKDLRDKPLEFKNYYLGLVYEKEGKIIISNNINEFPADYKEYTRPITLGEMFYSCIHTMTERTPAVLTRYPVTAEGGVYVAMPRIRTTTKSRTLIVIDSTGKETGEVYDDYPMVGESYYDSLAVHQSHIAPLIGDHDGDTVSAIFLNVDDSLNEIKSLLDKASYYKDIKTGKLLYSAKDSVSSLVLSHLTKF